MQASHLRIVCAGLAIAALLAACSVGPDYHRPAPPVGANAYLPATLPAVTAVTGTGDAQRLLPERDIPREWWTLFHNAALNTLIVEALRQNPDLQSARAALRVAMENASAQQGAYYPSLGAGFSPSRNQNSTALSPTLNSGPLLFNLYQAQLTANWTLDIWGANRRAVEALQAQADAQRFQLESTRLALTANVVAAAVQEASLRDQIAAVNDIIAADSDSLSILQRQLTLGQIAGADVAAQQAALAQAQQALPPLQKQLAQTRDQLTALAGRLPSDQVSETFVLSSLDLPKDVPVSVPANLIERRPDIRIAEANLHAASAQVGVAIADMLPNISIGANAGEVATHFGQLFTPGAGFWSVVGDATQPLFDGGTLLHKEKGARAAFDQAAAQYRAAVITAFQNVADTLYALQYDTAALNAATASEQAASDTLAIVRKQLQLGSVGYLGLLSAQQTYKQAVITRIQAQAARYADTAALFQALGGGWDGSSKGA